MPPTGNANFAWLQHMIHHLSPNGKIGMVLANGALSSNTGGEGEIRANIIKADLVEAIVALPAQLFYTTGIPVTLWFLNKNKKQKRKILFIDAREMGTMETRKLRVLTDDENGDIQKIASTFNSFENNENYQDIKGYCKVATLEDVEKEGFILTPGKYVGVAEVEQDSEPFETKMPRLKQEIFAMFEQSHKLEENIKAQLEKLSGK